MLVEQRDEEQVGVARHGAHHLLARPGARDQLFDAVGQAHVARRLPVGAQHLRAGGGGEVHVDAAIGLARAPRARAPGRWWRRRPRSRAGRRARACRPAPRGARRVEHVAADAHDRRRGAAPGAVGPNSALAGAASSRAAQHRRCDLDRRSRRAARRSPLGSQPGCALTWFHMPSIAFQTDDAPVIDSFSTCTCRRPRPGASRRSCWRSRPRSAAA